MLGCSRADRIDDVQENKPWVVNYVETNKLIAPTITSVALTQRVAPDGPSGTHMFGVLGPKHPV
jgi:hypothetical protein